MVKGGRNSRNSRNCCFKNRAKCNLSFPNDGFQNNGLHQIKHASNLMIMELVAMKVFWRIDEHVGSKCQNLVEGQDIVQALWNTSWCDSIIENCQGIDPPESIAGCSKKFESSTFASLGFCYPDQGNRWNVGDFLTLQADCEKVIELDPSPQVLAVLHQIGNMNGEKCFSYIGDGNGWWKA